MLLHQFMQKTINYEDEKGLSVKIDKCIRIEDEGLVGYEWLRGYQSLWIELRRIRLQSNNSPIKKTKEKSD